MAGLLENRVALITGGGRGIGRAIALAYAREGAKVALTARTEEQLQEVAKEIRAAGGTSLPLAADLADRSIPTELVARIQDQLGPVEILVNNAGVGSSIDPKPAAEFDDGVWDLTLEVNLTAPYLLSKAVLPQMLRAGWGRLVYIASINGKVHSFHGVAYTASKHGLLGLMRTIAAEVAGTGVTANAICPGPVRTAMNNKRVAYDADRLGLSLDQLERKITPIGRRLEPEEIAPLAVYFGSEAAACVTGQAYNVDGGLVVF